MVRALSLVEALHGKYTRALSFENVLCVPGGASSGSGIVAKRAPDTPAQPPVLTPSTWRFTSDPWKATRGPGHVLRRSVKSDREMGMSGSKGAGAWSLDAIATRGMCAHRCRWHLRASARTIALLPQPDQSIVTTHGHVASTCVTHTYAHTHAHTYGHIYARTCRLRTHIYIYIYLHRHVSYPPVAQ